MKSQPLQEGWRHQRDGWNACSYTFAASTFPAKSLSRPRRVYCMFYKIQLRNVILQQLNISWKSSYNFQHLHQSYFIIHSQFSQTIFTYFYICFRNFFKADSHHEPRIVIAKQSFLSYGLHGSIQSITTSAKRHMSHSEEAPPTKPKWTTFNPQRSTILKTQ